MATTGYFVDWNGDTRRVDAPGEGYTCAVVNTNSHISVNVIDQAGFVCHEATYFESLRAVEEAGVVVNLI